MNKFFISVSILLFILSNSNAQDPAVPNNPPAAQKITDPTKTDEIKKKENDPTPEKRDNKSESNQPSREVKATANLNNNVSKPSITSTRSNTKEKLDARPAPVKMKTNSKSGSSLKQETNEWKDIKKLKEDNGYLKFSIDKEITLEGNKVIIFHGEILPIKKEDSETLYALFDKAIIDVTATFKFNEFKFINEADDFSKSKKDYITKTDRLVHIDVSSFKDVSDTIRFVAEQQKMTPFIKEKEADLEGGENFRLIIPNSPTIFYSKNELLDYKSKTADTDYDGILDVDDRCPDIPGKANSDTMKNGCPPGFFTKLLGFWPYGLTALVFLAIAIGIRWYLQPPKYHTNSGAYVTYNGGSLKDFASQLELTIDQLIDYNSSIIPNDYVTMTKGQRKAFQKTLIGANLKIKSDNTNAKIDNEKNNDNFKLQGLERQIASLQSEKNRLQDTVSQLGNDKQLVISNFNLEKEQTKKLESDIKTINEKVLFLDYLNDFCEKGSFFFNLSEKVSNHAYDYCNQLINQNAQQSIPVTLLLMKYQLSINSVPIGKWKQIIHDIKDTGAATNKQLIRSLSQPKTEIDKQAEFYKLLNEEVLLKYSSSLLMFTEELRNLSRFEVDSHLVDEVQDHFAKHLEDLLIAMKSIGLKAKYVPLFKNYTENLGLTKSVDQKLSVAYQNVKGLEKDSVAEVISYGFITNFGDSDTLIILA